MVSQSLVLSKWQVFSLHRAPQNSPLPPSYSRTPCPTLAPEVASKSTTTHELQPAAPLPPQMDHS